MSAVKNPAELLDADESEIDETMNRIKSHKGVLGVIITTQDGLVLRSTMDAETANLYATLLHDLTGRTRHGVRDLDPANDLSFIRIRTKKHEIMVAPDKDYLMIVVQDPNFKEGDQPQVLRVRALPESVDDDTTR